MTKHFLHIRVFMYNRRGFLLLPVFVALSLIGNAQLIPGVVASSQQTSSPSRDADAVKFTTATGVTGSNLNAVDSLVKWLKDSSLWSKLQVIYPVIGGTASSHAYNLKDTSTFKLSFTGGWTHSSTGMKPNGSTGYANTGWNPNTQITDQTNWYNSAGIYLRTDDVGTYVDLGSLESQSGTDAYYQIYSNLGGTFYGQPAVKGSVGQNETVSSSKGWSFMSRTGSSPMYLQADLSQSDEYVLTYLGVPNLNVYLGAQNKNGVATYFSPREISFVVLSGQSFTKAQGLTLYRIVQKYETLLSRNVTK